MDMKNIHILPTDKPSRFFKDDFGKLFYSINIDQEQNHFKPQNIYITSDEEIIEGKEWFLDLRDNFIFKNQVIEPMSKVLFPNCKKIILTTDQDLIKDGVQAIDNEFLEWFVKNSSCENIEVKQKDNWYVHTGSGKYWEDAHVRMKRILNLGDYEYKIIIPKEEVKYPILGYAPGNYMCNCSTCKTQFQGDKRAVQCEPCAIKMTKKGPKQKCKGSFKDCFKPLYECICDKMKQETLEEAAEEWIKGFGGVTNSKNSFKEGAKWQAERSYSEEEVRELLLTQRGNCYVAILTKTRDNKLASVARLAPEPSGKNGWVKQFKKKT